jgi:hypothetical protein
LKISLVKTPNTVNGKILIPNQKRDSDGKDSWHKKAHIFIKRYFFIEAQDKT